MDNPWTMEIEIGRYSKGACRAKGPRMDVTGMDETLQDR